MREETGRDVDVIQDYQVTLFYTAPTAIRSFMKQGHEIPDKFDMASLRIFGSVGEPINPEAYAWYRHVIGATAPRSSTPGGRPRPAPP